MSLKLVSLFSIFLLNKVRSQENVYTFDRLSRFLATDHPGPTPPAITLSLKTNKDGLFQPSNPFYITQNAAPLDFIFDLNQDVLVISQDAYCKATTCLGSQFTNAFYLNTINDTQGTAGGYYYTTQIEVPTSYSPVNYNFFLKTQTVHYDQKNISNSAYGIFGFTRNTLLNNISASINPDFNSKLLNSTSVNFFEQLYANGVIQRKMIAMYVDGDYGVLHIGGYDGNTVHKFGKSSLDDIIWTPMADTSIPQFNVQVQNIQLRKANVLGFTPLTAIFDNTRDDFLFPYDTYVMLHMTYQTKHGCNTYNFGAGLIQNAKNYVHNSYNFFDNSTVIACECHSQASWQLQPLVFVIQGEIFSFDAMDYMDYHVGGYCIPRIRLNRQSNQTIVLGSPFLKKYYTIFDADNQKVGLAGRNKLYSAARLAIIVLCTVGVCVCCCGCSLLYYCIKACGRRSKGVSFRRTSLRMSRKSFK